MQGARRRAAMVVPASLQSRTTRAGAAVNTRHHVPPIPSNRAPHCGACEAGGSPRFRLGVKGEKDRDGRNRQANRYYFRVDGGPRREMTFDLVDLPGEYNYQPNRGAVTGDTQPVVSFDGIAWKHVDRFEYDASGPALRVRVMPEAAQFWGAHASIHQSEPGAPARRSGAASRFPGGSDRANAGRTRPVALDHHHRRFARQAVRVAHVLPAQLGKRQFGGGRRCCASPARRLCGCPWTAPPLRAAPGLSHRTSDATLRFSVNRRGSAAPPARPKQPACRWSRRTCPAGVSPPSPGRRSIH